MDYLRQELFSRKPLESEILSSLQAISARQIIDEASQRGRVGFDPETVSAMRRLYNRARTWRQLRNKFPTEIAKALTLCEEFLWAENFIHEEPEPRYIAYTHLRVLDHFIMASSWSKSSDIIDRCKFAIALLVRDWTEYETDALISDTIGKLDTIGFNRERVTERVDGLRSLRSLVAQTALPDLPRRGEVPSHLYPSDWMYYASEHNGAIGLVHLTGLTRSRWHDEYMFLRTIHISECCFWGMIVSIRAGMLAYQSDDKSTSRNYFAEATQFGGWLVKLFSIFETMPIESFFDGFREATGNASAIQSRKFQILDKLTRGYNSTKTSAVRGQTETRDLSAGSTADGWDLISFTAQLGASDLEVEIKQRIERLQRHLFAWRSKHFGIATRYLPKDVAGTGEEGVPYLKATFRDPNPVESSVEPVTDDTINVRLTPAFEINAGNTALGWLEADEVDLNGLQSTLLNSGFLDQVFSYESKRQTEMSYSVYDAYFSRYNLDFPVSRQFRNMGKNFDEPAGLSIPKILMLLEFRFGVLLGIYNRSRFQGQPRFDTAVAGEIFTTLGGSDVACVDGEWVLRDGKDIFSSVVRGPDARTALRNVTEPGKVDALSFAVLGVPDLPENLVIQATNGIADLVSPHASVVRTQTWVIEE